MKMLIAFLLCALMQTYCVAVLDESIDNKQMNEFTKASNECIREMNRDLRFINDKGPPTDPCVTEDPNMVVCVNKKLGLMNEDGSYNLESVLSFFFPSETAEQRQRVIDNFTNGTIKECSTAAGGDPCKMVACAHGLLESLCGRKPNENDGC